MMDGSTAAKRGGPTSPFNASLSLKSFCRFIYANMGHRCEQRPGMPFTPPCLLHAGTHPSQRRCQHTRSASHLVGLVQLEHRVNIHPA